VEPLFDIRGRVVSFNAHTPVEMTIDALLRLHADPKRWQKPITLYVGLGMDFQRPAKTIEALSVCGVLGCLRSPIHTVAVGIINQSNALVLAAGNPGHRYMLPHSMV
jgi:ATP-dependent Clp protease protease subunit